MNIIKETVTLFTTQDRCDKCNAQALMRATKGGYELLFCGHHGTAFLSSLEQQNWLIERAN